MHCWHQPQAVPSPQCPFPACGPAYRLPLIHANTPTLATCHSPHPCQPYAHSAPGMARPAILSLSLSLSSQLTPLSTLSPPIQLCSLLCFATLCSSSMGSECSLLLLWAMHLPKEALRLGLKPATSSQSGPPPRPQHCLFLLLLSSLAFLLSPHSLLSSLLSIHSLLPL